MSDMTVQLIMLGQVFLSLLLGALIGLEREYHAHPAGVRTYAAVCIGACVFGLVSTHAQGASFYTSVVDPTRIAAQVASGIGFLGAGVIFRDGFNTSGLTTAATIWASAAIGLAISFEMYFISVVTTLLIIALLFLSHIPGWSQLTGRNGATLQSEEPYYDE